MNNLITDIISPNNQVNLKIGLYFGSYNPIHIGHLVIANYMVEFTDIDQLWFVVSPQNPHKKKQSLLDDYQRLELVHRAINDDSRFRVSNIEFNMPKPSFTIDTLTYLSEQFPQHQFVILMGSDNLRSFHKWKNYETIRENHEILVYPRSGFKADSSLHSNIKIVDAPHIEIASTSIRKAIKEGKDMRHFLQKKVWEYIEEMNFYK